MTQGEVWFAVLDPVRGSEQAGTRPVLILQSNPLNAFLRTVIVIPFTTNLKWARFPFCVHFPAAEAGLPAESVALCHQMRIIDKSRLLRRLGQVSETTMAKVEQAIRAVLRS